MKKIASLLKNYSIRQIYFILTLPLLLITGCGDDGPLPPPAPMYGVPAITCTTDQDCMDTYCGSENCLEEGHSLECNDDGICQECDEDNDCQII